MNSIFLIINFLATIFIHASENYQSNLKLIDLLNASEICSHSSVKRLLAYPGIKYQSKIEAFYRTIDSIVDYHNDMKFDNEEPYYKQLLASGIKTVEEFILHDYRAISWTKENKLSAISIVKKHNIPELLELLLMYNPNSILDESMPTQHNFQPLEESEDEPVITIPLTLAEIQISQLLSNHNEWAKIYTNESTAYQNIISAGKYGLFQQSIRNKYTLTHEHLACIKKCFDSNILEKWLSIEDCKKNIWIKMRNVCMYYLWLTNKCTFKSYGPISKNGVLAFLITKFKEDVAKDIIHLLMIDYLNAN